MVAAGFGKEAVDNRMGILSGGEYAVIGLCGQSDTVTLEPLVSVAVVKLPEEVLHKPVTVWIDLREVGDVGKGVGAVATATARDGHLGQQVLTTLQDGNFHLGHHLLQVDCQEKAGSTTSNNCRLHVFLTCG